MALRGSRIAWGIVAGLSLAGTGLGFVGAQANSPNAAPQARDEAPAAPGSIAEMLDGGQVVVSDGKHLKSRIEEMIDDARDAHDIIRVTCLNEKLVQVQGTTESAEERVGNLQAAQRENDVGRAQHEHTLVLVLRDKLDVLDRQAAQCAGQDVYETGTTVVTTEIDPNNPPEDPSVIAPPDVVNPVPVIPPPASAAM